MLSDLISYLSSPKAELAPYVFSLPHVLHYQSGCDHRYKPQHECEPLKYEATLEVIVMSAHLKGHKFIVLEAIVEEVGPQNHHNGVYEDWIRGESRFWGEKIKVEPGVQLLI